LFPSPTVPLQSRSSPAGFEKNIFINTKNFFLNPHPSSPITHPKNIFIKNLDRLPSQPATWLSFFFSSEIFFAGLSVKKVSSGRF